MEVPRANIKTRDTKPQPAETAGGHYMQTAAWADVRHSNGFEVRTIDLKLPKLGERTLFMYLRNIPGLGKMAYAPMLPDVFQEDSVADALRSEAKSAGAFVVRIEPSVGAEKIDWARANQLGYQKRGKHIQYLSTIIIDLKRDFEAVFADYNSTARNEIRKGVKAGVQCARVPMTEENISKFLDVLQSTQQRQDFWLRSKTFTKEYLKKFDETGQANLYFAEYEGKVLSVAFIITNGNVAFYKDGGAVFDPETRSLAAPSVLQWYIMQDLQAHGVERYDLCGVSATGKLEPTDPLWGVYKFKSKFSSDLYTYPGFIDLPVKGINYRIWKAAERYITRIYRKITGDIFY